MRTTPLLTFALASLAFGAFAACSGSTISSTTEDVSSALSSAQCSNKDFEAAQEDCFDKAIADGSATADELAACLPHPKGGKGGKGGPGGEHGDCDGGPPPPPSGSAPPPPPSGSAPPPGGHGPDGDGDHGGRGGGHHGPHPDPVALQACHDTLASCVAAGTDAKTCFDAARTCMKDAFKAAFDAACADAKTKCDAGEIPADKCTEITAHCAAGPNPPAGAAGAPTCK